MNKNDVLIDIELLKANPFQPRKDEDAAAVAEIAQNILHNATEEFDGLLQAPTAREAAGGWFELAFGHTRLAALRALVEQGHERYQQMRVNVRELSDLQMFELAVTENIKRRDLNPIEQAEAIKTYQETFGKTSAEAAEFFGVAASTVRGWVRLLNLPEAAREKVRTGEINTGAARALLVVDKVMGEGGVEEVLERMADDGDGPMEAIEGALRYSDDTERLDRDDKWVTVDPFPRKYWKPVTNKKEIVSLLIEEDESELDGKEEDFERLVSYVAGGMDVTDDAFSMFTPEGLERVRVLVNPPGCMSCPLHAQLDRNHYCALKACAGRKQDAWFSEVAESVSAETGIAMYDKGRDGACEKLNMYNDDSAKLWTAGHEDLRLMPAKAEVYGNRQVDLDVHVQVVVVGKTLEKMHKKDAKQKVREEKKQDKEMPWEVRSKIANTVREFVYSVEWEAAKSFAALFDGLSNFAVLKLLCADVYYPDNLQEDELVAEAEGMKKKADGLAQMRRIVAMGIVERETNYNSGSNEPIVAFGKTVTELAKELGVKLPKDWAAEMKKLDAACAMATAEIVQAWKEKK